MPDSLLVSGGIELLGGGVVVQDGPAAGTVMRLGQDYRMGAPDVDQDTVISLLMDGERPYGDRSKNREMSIPVMIFAPGRILLERARESLLQLVEQQSWELQYTPEGMQPLIFDCFRATIDQDQTGINEARQDYALVVLTFSALPYGRSTDPQVINITVDAPSQIAPVLLDGFEQPPGAAWYTTSSPRVEGARSVFTYGQNRGGRNFAPKDLSQMASIKVWTTVAGPGNARGYTLALADAHGSRWSVGLAQTRLRGNNAWDVITWRLTDAPSTFDLANVTGYNITVSGGVYLDNLVAVPPQSQVATSTRGGMVRIPGVMGTARAPVNVQLSRPSAAVFSQFLLHRPPQDAPELYTPLVPLDPTAVPNGTQQPMPTVDGQTGGLRFNGTYTVIVVFASFGGSGNRTITLDLRQFYNDAGVTAPTDHAGLTLTGVMNPTDGAMQIIGQVPLPLLDGAADNSAATWTVGVTSSVTTDRICDILLLDTRGETVFVTSTRQCGTFWVDEPDVIRDPFDMIGKIVGGTTRAQALSVAGDGVLPSRPLALDPGDNTWLMYNPQESPQATLMLYPRWRTVRLA